jgi:UDP-glucose 4-epimerase
MSKVDMEVVGFDVDPPKHKFASIKYLQGDLFDSDALKRVLLNCEINSIVNLVGLPNIDECERDPDKSRVLNVDSVRSLIRAMGRDSHVTVTFASSAAVYGNHSAKSVQEDDRLAPSSVYGRHKLEAEEALRLGSELYGLRYVILRLFNVYGRIPPSGSDILSILLRNALNGKTTKLKGRNKFRDFIGVDDVAYAMCSVVSNQITNKAINVGTGHKTTLGEVSEIISSMIPGTKVEVQPSGDDWTGLVADKARMKSLLGIEPRPPKEGIAAYVTTAINEANRSVERRAT